MAPAITASSGACSSASATSSTSTGTRPPRDSTFAERQEVETAYLGWLGPTLAQVRNARQRSSAGVQVGTPPGTRYTFEGAVATALGPRDDAWVESAIADPRIAIEVTPWWSDATDSRYMLNRALALMWLQVRWRKPALDGESEMLEDVHRLLSKAYPIEPDLPYPWHAWAELVSFSGIEDGMTRQVNTRSKVEPPEAAIGYRRDPVSITHEGWVLEVPGEFAERRTDEEWWGGGAGRSITLAATDTGSMSASAFLTHVAGDLGAEALTHQAGPVVGRARIMTDESSGVAVGVLDGYSAVNGSGAAIRIVFDDPNDWQWALDQWRALAPADTRPPRLPSQPAWAGHPGRPPPTAAVAEFQPNVEAEMRRQPDQPESSGRRRRRGART